MNIHFTNTLNSRQKFQELQRLVEQQVRSLPKSRLTFARIRAFTLFFLYWLSYAVAISQGDLTTLFVGYMLMGLLGFLLFINVIHETCHGNIFSSSRWNKLGYQIFDLLGMNSFIWKKRHNILHHNYTNISGWDSDIEQSGLIKVYPHESPTLLQRFQHYYFFFFYPLYLINWVFLRDFKDYLGKSRIVRKITAIPLREWFKLLLFKGIFIFYLILIPWLVFGFPLGTMIMAVLLLLLIGGTISLAALLTPHVNIGNTFPLPNTTGNMETDWLRHQLMTTNDIDIDNFLTRYVLGNFNYHVAHHLFPTISSVYAPEVTAVIHQYARAHQLPYRSISFWEALKQHFLLIKQNTQG